MIQHIATPFSCSANDVKLTFYTYNYLFKA